ncbi:MAG TPA: amidohydrolase [Caldilineae bacterium]|nr:amidohydrolase [Caldilineae bacterium]
MPNILLKHATIVTLNDEDAILTDADLAIADDRIVALGEIPADFAADEVLDLSGKIVTPGLYNAHTHAAMVFARGYAEDMSLDRWFNEGIWKLESALSRDMVRWGVRLAMVEMVRGGVIGFADHYFYMDEVAQAVVESGMRANLAWAVFGHEEGEVGITVPETVAFVMRWQGAADGRLRTMFGPHSPYLCSDEFLARTAAVAVREGIGIHIHAAETAGQVEASLAQYDMTPIELLHDRGLFETHTIVAHAIYSNPLDIRILANSNVNVAHCPSTHLRYAMGVTPVPEMLAAGVNVALGADGAGSSVALNLWREMRLAVVMQRQARRDPEALGGLTPLRMAARHGARALGFTESGALAPGYQADLIVIDATQTHYQPIHSVVASLVWNTEPADVQDVMVAGRWLMRDRKLLTLDEETIRVGFQQALAEMMAKPLGQFKTYEVGA